MIPEHDGTIDKFIGDCVMGLWNAPLDFPDHRQCAIRAARQIVIDIDALSRNIAQERVSAGLPPLVVSCGVGLNTGSCVVGNMGTATRFDYTAIGDGVNLSARLEARTKYYGLPILIGATTTTGAPEGDFCEVDRIHVKGRHESVRIFTPSEVFEERGVRLQAEALGLYRRQDWDRAENIWREIAAISPRAAAYAGLMLGRINDFRQAPPDPGWTGEWTFSEK